MVRRGQQDRRALKRAEAEANRELESQQGSYRPPPREDCTKKEWCEFADDAATIRITFIIWRHEGRLADFVLLVELSDWDAWATLSRIDCCWGFCHLHPPGREETHEPIHRLDSLDDVEEAFAGANQIADTIARTIRDRKVDGSND